MLRILPLAAPLHDPRAVDLTISRISAELNARGVAHEMLGDAGGQPDALLIATGGTEHLALARLDEGMAPAILIAHATQNSLPAALEILGRLRQMGRPARIHLLNDGREGYDGLAHLGGFLSARRRLQETRLGRIGTPSDWLVASTPDPGVVQETWGPTVVDVPIGRLLGGMTDVDPREVERIREEFLGGAGSITDLAPAAVDSAARVAAALGRLVREERLDACTVRCFDLIGELRTTGCLAVSWLLDAGVVAGCEGDVPAALTMLWLLALTGQATFMANPQDLDAQANTLWLAHCTVARGLVSGYSLRSHFESGTGVGIEGRFEPGPATLARIGGRDLRSLFASDAMATRVDSDPLRCRTQVEVRLESPVKDLLAGALGNHHVLARGRWAAALREYHELLIGDGL